MAEFMVNVTRPQGHLQKLLPAKSLRTKQQTEVCIEESTLTPGDAETAHSHVQR